MFVRRLAVLAVALCASVPAWADAVTYSGTVGTRPVLLEITEPADGPLVGRMTFLADGVDIPLRPFGSTPNGLQFAQELPCDSSNCPVPSDGQFDPPLGAVWMLTFVGDQRLVGTWTDGTTPQAVELSRVGSRPYDRYDTFAYQSFLWKAYGQPLTGDVSPYDYRKMLINMDKFETAGMSSGAAYWMVRDPRTGFSFPRVVQLPNDAVTDSINARLDAMHWDRNLSGFACLGMAYLSAGWNRAAGPGQGTPGGVGEDEVLVNYLSDRVMSIAQSGDFACGGTASYHHVDTTTLDVRTGEDLDLSLVFRGWVPSQNGLPVKLYSARSEPQRYTWGPNQTLLSFVSERLRDSDQPEECGYDALIGDYLDISFAEGDVAVFRVDDPEAFDPSCEGELFSVPLADIPQLLADDAADVFPSLKP